MLNESKQGPYKEKMEMGSILILATGNQSEPSYPNSFVQYIVVPGKVNNDQVLQEIFFSLFSEF